jgi:lipopolysaccharide transport system permease protein
MAPAAKVGSAAPDRNPPVYLIEPPRGWSALQFRELWTSRDLIYFMAWRDVKVRYTQAVMGVAWAVIQPVLLMVVFSIFLGRLAKVPSAGVPYPLFVFAGLVPYTFFANSVSSATESLVTNSKLVSKVYFPRVVIPLAALVSWLPDFGIALSLLTGLMLLYGLIPGWSILALPLFAGIALLTATSIAVWLSALNVAYRDVRYATPFVLQLWLFASPIVYPVSLVPEQYRLIYGLNPLAGVVEGIRWSLLGGRSPDWALVAVSAGIAVVLLAAGMCYFRRVETFFADLI